MEDIQVENLVNKYTEKLKQTNNPGIVLAEFFCEAFNTTGNYFAIFNRLIRMYGRDRVFMSILDCYDYNKFDPEDPIRLLTYNIKRKLNADITPTTILNEKTVKVKKLNKSELSRLKDIELFKE